MYRRKLDAHDMFILKGVYERKTLAEMGNILFKNKAFVQYRIKALIVDGFVLKPAIKGQARNHTLTNVGLEVLKLNSGKG